MSEDKDKAVKLAKKAILQGYAAKLPLLMTKKIVERFGEEGWEVLEEAAKEFAVYRVPLMKVLVDDPNNARSLGKIFDFEDSLSGIKGEWKEIGAKKAVKIERECMPSEVYQEFPDYCLRLLWLIASETLKGINPKADLKPFSKVKCIVAGDDCCEVKVSIAD